MSKALYKSAPPKLFGHFSSEVSNRSIEVWNTTCIVTNFGKDVSESSCNVLINPCNPELSGVSKFPYFPRGGPVPKEEPKTMHKDWQPLGYVSQWGGMDVGDGMLYPASVVDGMVHQLGGTKLSMECKWITSFKGGCPTGTSVTTHFGSKELIKAFDMIIHTSPPFYRHTDDSINLLRQCYKSSLLSAFSENDDRRVAVPLIGAGARGFPLETALNIAVDECSLWRDDERSCFDRQETIAFGIPEDRVAIRLLQLLEEEGNGIMRKPCH